jgi:sugar phosphate isomerase/epimerase
MSQPKVGLQLWTIRHLVKEDFFEAIRKVKEIGYDGIEFQTGFMDVAAPEAMKQALDEIGIELAGAVVTWNELLEKVDEIVHYCHVVETPSLTLAGIFHKPGTIEEWREIAGKLNEFGKKCNDLGYRFLYHVHGHEFKPIDGIVPMDAMIEVFDPECVQLEVDVYWVEWGGMDAVEFLKKYGHISPFIHMKDTADKSAPERFHDVEVGTGVIDVEGVARIALANNAEWFIVEQEAFDMDPLDSIKISLKNTRKLAVLQP